MTDRPAVLELRGIDKRFGSVAALSGADFSLRRGEIHALLGENGAGKSTLMHVAFGLVRADAGIVRVRGTPVRIQAPKDARALGIGMVHQHFTSIPTLSVAENLALASDHRSAVHPGDRGRMADLRARLGADLSPGTVVEDLSVGQKQRLEILQAMAADADILLLDEPTAVLAPAEIEELLQLLRFMAESGASLVLITHKLGEVAAVADRVTVLRRGRVVLSGSAASETAASLARAMIGEAWLEGDSMGASEAVVRPNSARRGMTRKVRVRYPLAARAQEIRAESVGDREPAAALEIEGGELIGLAAVEGNGQREFLRELAGLAPRPGGAVVAGPVAFVPEDRSVEGLVPGFSLAENLVLGLQDDPRWRKGIWISWPAARHRTAELLGEFGIQASGPDTPARSLSGGNQQKLVFARAVEGCPAVVVAENPTRGLDVRATRFVHDRLRRLAADGAAVVMYSTDLDEVLLLATRVLVMRGGQLREAPLGAKRDEVGAMMLGALG